MWITAICFLILLPKIIWQSSKDAAIRKKEGNDVHLLVFSLITVCQVRVRPMQ